MLSVRLIAVALLLAFVPVTQTTAWPCTNETDGVWGTTTAECSWTCREDMQIHVKVINSDPDQNIVVDGKAKCGGIEATCSAIRTCQGDSEVPTVSNDGLGLCRGVAHDWWDSHTNVSCWESVPSETNLCQLGDSRSVIPICDSTSAGSPASSIHLTFGGDEPPYANACYALLLCEQIDVGCASGASRLLCVASPKLTRSDLIAIAEAELEQGG